MKTPIRHNSSEVLSAHINFMEAAAMAGASTFSVPQAAAVQRTGGQVGGSALQVVAHQQVMAHFRDEL